MQNIDPSIFGLGGGGVKVFKYRYVSDIPQVGCGIRHAIKCTQEVAYVSFEVVMLKYKGGRAGGSRSRIDSILICGAPKRWW